MLRTAALLVALCAVFAAAADDDDDDDDARMLPRCLIAVDDLAFDAFDEDAGAHLVAAGRFAEMRALALEARPHHSLEFRNNAALTYLLEGDTLAADVMFAALARFCDARWDWRASDGGRGPLDRAPVEVLGPCLAVYKNWNWALAARPEGGDAALADPTRELARDVAAAAPPNLKKTVPS